METGAVEELVDLDDTGSDLTMESGALVEELAGLDELGAAELASA